MKKLFWIIIVVTLFVSIESCKSPVQDDGFIIPDTISMPVFNGLNPYSFTISKNIESKAITPTTYNYYRHGYDIGSHSDAWVRGFSFGPTLTGWTDLDTGSLNLQEAYYDEYGIHNEIYLNYTTVEGDMSMAVALLKYNAADWTWNPPEDVDTYWAPEPYWLPSGDWQDGDYYIRYSGHFNSGDYEVRLNLRNNNFFYVHSKLYSRIDGSNYITNQWYSRIGFNGILINGTDYQAEGYSHIWYNDQINIQAQYNEIKVRGNASVFEVAVKARMGASTAITTNPFVFIVDSMGVGGSIARDEACFALRHDTSNIMYSIFTRDRSNENNPWVEDTTGKDEAWYLNY